MMSNMEFGIAFANTLQFTEHAGLVALAQSAESAGFDSLWTVEHVIFPDGYQSEYPYDRSGKMAADASSPIPDPLIWLSFVAAATTTLRLGTGILILPQRNPLILAKEVATLDRLSGGRVELGVGVGWLEEEFDALGVPFERRGARTDEYIAAMRALWADDHVDFDGEFTSFSGASVNPKPAGSSVPITIGGHSVPAARRAGRLGDGFFPAKGDIAELVDVMRQTAADAGRDPSAITVSTGSVGVFGDDPAAEIEELADKGVDRIIVPAFAFMNDTVDMLAAFGERVIAPSR